MQLRCWKIMASN